MDSAEMAARMYAGTTAADRPATPPAPATDSRATTTANLNAAYPTAAPEVDSTPQQAAPLTDAEKALRLFPAPESLPKVYVPENIAALRASDAERKMYSAQSTYKQVLPDNLLDGVDVPAPVRVAFIAEQREIAADLGLFPDEARVLASRLVSVSQAHMTAEQDGAAYAMVATILTDKYGIEADRKFADVEALIARDPRLSILREKVFKDPEAVMLLAEVAKRQRVDGKIS